MSAPAQPSTCPHGLRPGTTVCLHCRHEARAAARKRRYTLAARIGLATMGAAALVALGVGGILSMADDSPSSEPAAPVSVAGSQAGAGSGGGAAASGAPGAPRAPAVRAPVGPTPIIAEGRRELGDSMYAVRAGDSVTV